MPVCGNYLFFELPKKIVLNPKDGFMHKWKPMVLQFKKRLKMTAPAFFSRIRFLTTFSLCLILPDFRT